MGTYRVGVIGSGGIGIQHGEGVLGVDSAAVVACCDLLPETTDAFREHFKSEYPDIRAYRDYRDMLEVENLNVVTVATSDHRHADLVVDAANAGAKGIFCEKPIATTLEDADRMIEAAGRNGTVLSIDHTRRWQPIWRRAKELLDEGVIGPVQYVISTLGGPRAMLFRNGTHLIDAICYYAGSEPSWVMGDLEDGYEDYSEYRGDGGHDPATEPSVHGYIRFANGVRGHFAGGPKTTPKASRVEIVGTTGHINVDGGGARILRGDHRGYESEPIDVPEWPVVGIPAGVRELLHVLDDSDLESKNVSCTGEEGRWVLEVMLGFLASQQRGNARVDLPLVRG